MSLDHHFEEPTAIRTNLGAIFVSLELSRSTWLITSLSPGAGEKMSKHGVSAGNVAALLTSVRRFLHLQGLFPLRTDRRRGRSQLRDVGSWLVWRNGPPRGFVARPRPAAADPPHVRPPPRPVVADRLRLSADRRPADGVRQTRRRPTTLLARIAAGRPRDEAARPPYFRRRTI